LRKTEINDKSNFRLSESAIEMTKETSSRIGESAKEKVERVKRENGN